MPTKIVILATDLVQALDITGPASVFAGVGRFTDGPPPYQVRLVSPRGGVIQTNSGLALDSLSIGEVSPDAVDLLLVAGHEPEGLRALGGDRQVRLWVQAVAAAAPRWGSVCTGTFPLAHWGLLDGRQAVTHWAGTDQLAERYPAVSVQPDALFVRDGPVWTSAGVTAGIDMALAIVETDLGADLAAKIARQLVVYLRRPGSQSQFSDALASQQAAAPYAELIAWAREHLHRPLTVSALADRAGQSPRTFQRNFAKVMGKTPAAFVKDLRLERAKTLIDAGVPLKQVAGRVGYPSAAQLTIAFRRKLGVAPSVWRAMHGCRASSC